MLKRIGFAVCCAMVASTPLGAMNVQPLRIMIEPAKGQTSATIAVNNTRDRALPFEIVAERRIIAQDGSQTYEPADDSFVIFPPQGNVDVGRSQAIRVQYVGPPVADKTQGYVIRVKEVPVQDPNFEGVRFAYAYGVAFYIKPERARDNVQVNGFRKTEEGLEIDLVNDGNDYSLLTEKRLRIEAGAEKLNFERQQLSEMIEFPLVAPGGKRTLKIKLPKQPTGTITAVAFDIQR